MREFFHSVGMFADPAHEDLDDFSDLVFREGMSGWDAVPFPKAFSAAASGCMLCDETGMTPHRSLFAVMLRLCGSEPFFDEIAALQFHDFESVFGKEPEFGFSQFETRPEF